jgi:uncharacterized protein YaaW (UPF0174 family)
MPNKKTDTLPEKFRKYFWDVSFDDLSFNKYPGFIAERLLNYGDLHAMKWLLSHTEKKLIKTLTESSRNLNVKTKNYWKTILK